VPPEPNKPPVPPEPIKPPASTEPPQVTGKPPRKVETVDEFVKRGGVIQKDDRPAAVPDPRVKVVPKSEPEDLEDLLSQGNVSIRKSGRGKRGKDIYGKENPKTAAGTLAHNQEATFQNATVLTDMMKRAGIKRGIFSEPIPKDAVPEFQVPHPDYPPGMKPRIDRLVSRDGVIIEIKPKHLKAQGDIEAQQYAEWMNKFGPPPPKGGKWKWKTITYDQKKLMAYLKEIGFFE
jgi:hypothetical protein